MVHMGNLDYWARCKRTWSRGSHDAVKPNLYYNIWHSYFRFYVRVRTNRYDKRAPNNTILLRIWMVESAGDDWESAAVSQGRDLWINFILEVRTRGTASLLDVRCALSSVYTIVDVLRGDSMQGLRILQSVLGVYHFLGI